MTHLGDRMAALVDGELGHEARDRALAHLAGCPSCRVTVEAERRLKGSLRGLPAPDVPDELVGRLLALSEPGEPMPPRRGSMPGTRQPPTLPPPGRRPTGGPYTVPPGSRRPARSRRLRRVAVLSGSAFTVAGFALGAAFLLGAPQGEPGAPLAPPVTTFSVEHAATTNGLPLTDPAVRAVQASYSGATYSGGLPSTSFGTISFPGAVPSPVPSPAGTPGR